LGVADEAVRVPNIVQAEHDDLGGVIRWSHLLLTSLPPTLHTQHTTHLKPRVSF
jgi:hypothetical protein